MKWTHYPLIASLLVPIWSAGVPTPAHAASPANTASTPPELGLIPWKRNLPKALTEASTTGKPTMILFDEVPGCGTCKQFGAGPLSHPIVVDAASLFSCVAVYNNVPGDDAGVLKKYKEPSWNNPVVRFVDSKGKDLIPRHADDYSTGGLIRAMTTALNASNQPTPWYLALTDIEYNPKQKETATFAMHCYWEGEQKLWKLAGVLGTRIGMLDKMEVVEVDFDASKLTYKELAQQAQKQDCAHHIFARTDKQVAIAKAIVGDKVSRTDAPVDTSTQQQYHLSKAPQYHYLPLTQLQATKVNATLADGKSPDAYLSPYQVSLKARITALQSENAVLLAKLQPKRKAAALPVYWQELEKALRSIDK